MNRTFRKYGKQIMAVLGVLLMIAFALPSACSSNYRRGDTALGTIRNGKETLTARDYNTYVREWSLLKSKFGPVVLSAVLGGGGQLGDDALVEILADPQAANMLQQFASIRQRNPSLYFQLLQMQPGAANMAILEERGEQVYVQLDQNPEMFVLLAKEAESMGLGAHADVVESTLVRMGVNPETDPDQYGALRQSLRTLLSIDTAANVAASVVKVSQPQLVNRLASQRQEVALNLVEFAAKDFLDKVPAPTDDQLKAQFDKYKDVEANPSPAPDAKNPLGFGYKYPNRVKYDAVLIRKEDVRKGVPAIEADEAMEYYLRNKGQFTATTQPTTQDSFSLSSGPTTRQQTFAEARERIVKTLTDQRADDLATKVRDAVRNTMRADFDAYRAATGGGTTRPTTGASTATAAAAPASSLGVPYNSYDYLKKLRDKVQADHKVTLTIEQQDGWQTPAQLEESKLGKAGYATDSGVALPRFLTSRVEAFVPEELRKELAQRGGDNKPVAVWEASPNFRDVSDDVLIARATAADPTHVPATLDEVKDKVAADVKLAAAYDAARKAAQATLDTAKAGKWLTAAAAEQNKKVITTGLFGAASNGMSTPLPVSGYDLKGPALTQFVQGAFKILAQAPRAGGTAPRAASTQSTTRPTTAAVAKATTSPATAPVVAAFKDHPIGLIELPADGKVIVAEVDQLKPTWSKDREAFFTARTALEARFEIEQALRQAWLQYDAVTTRLGYVPAEKRERKTPRQNQPINPFTGQVTP
jgi:hypothetical protein